jgi:hypothetical protein
VIDPTKLLIEAVGDHLRGKYRESYGRLDEAVPEIVGWATGLALENIARSDATYHDVQHTALVVQCGAELLRCRHLVEGGVSPRDWLHVVLSLLFHDVGYVRGVCREDRPGAWVSGTDDPPIALPAGASDAALMPWHVDRGMRFVRERFAGHPFLDAEELARNIAYTRFPVPTDRPGFDETRSWRALCRAADLIGQMGDPLYLRKTPALFAEMRENRQHEVLGFAHPDDLRASFPAFFEASVRPWIGDAVAWLSVTIEGRRWLAQLDDNVRRAPVLAASH